VKRGEGKEGIANLIGIYAVARGVSEDEVEAEFEGAGYGDLKKAVADAVVEFLAPVRERYPEIREDEAEIERILAGDRFRDPEGRARGDGRRRPLKFFRFDEIAICG